MSTSPRPLRIAFPVVIAGAILALVAYVLWPSPHLSSPRPAVRAREAAAAPRSEARRREDDKTGVRARYRLSSEHHAAVNGKESASVRVAGTWTTTERAENRSEVELAATRIEVVGDAAPSAAEVAAPFLLVSREGLLVQMAFSPSTPDKGRHLLSSIATMLQVTERADETWTVVEEDLTGRYEALYTRAGEKVLRSRGRYVEMRDAKGLGGKPGDMLVSDEHSEFVFDGRGLVSATVKLLQTADLGKGLPSVKMVAEASLVREDVSEVALVPGVDLVPEAISGHFDRAGLERKRLEAQVAGATPDSLLAEAAAAAHLDAKAPDTNKTRSAALRRMRILAELDQNAPGKLADGIRHNPTDRDMVGLVAGALSSADSPAATHALVSLLADPLPHDARAQILGQLGLARSPTAESAGELSKALDAPQGRLAALALGAQAGKLGENGAGKDAIDLLLERYAAAGTPEDKRIYLDALANTASRRALPVMQDAIKGPDYALARLAAFGLRLIPGDDVDDLLAGLIGSGSPVMVEAITATGHRSPVLWKPRLDAWRAQFAGVKRVVDAIQAVLGRWANPVGQTP